MFRIKRYATNFETKENGCHYDLDFAVIKDLAILDYEFRMMIDYLTANVEHGIKIRFNQLLMSLHETDGKTIAAAFDVKREYVYSETAFGDPTSKLKSFPYTDDLVRGYCLEPEIWNLWELFTLADLSESYRCYLKSIDYEDNSIKLFNGVRNLRNAASHNMPILLDIDRRGYIPPYDYVTSCLKEMFDGDVPMPVPSAVKKSQLVFDYASLLCSFLITCNSQPIRIRAGIMVQTMKDRILLHYGDYYAGNAHCRNLRNMLGAIVKLSEGFADYIETEKDSANRRAGMLHFFPKKRMKKQRIPNLIRS
nr:Abi family protein [Bifidobacterium sp. SO1]